MMIECPRCGFAQPKDQYCASCGVNMEQLLARPKPFMVRLLQNPNFHLSLIALLVVVVVGWIVYTQSAVVSREVGRILDLPVSSKNAADPNEMETATEHGKESNEAQEAPPPSAPEPMAGAVATGESRSPEEVLAQAVGAPDPKAVNPQRIEVQSWEVPREALESILGGATELGEGSAGRAYYLAQGAKALETLSSIAQTVGRSRGASLTNNAQVNQVTGPTAPEMFQLSLGLMVSKWENKQASVSYAVSFVLPQPEPPGASGPAIRQVMKANLSGSATLAPPGVIVLLLDPPNRAPREEYVNKAGEGPWSIFLSPDFRQSSTDWIAVVELK